MNYNVITKDISNGLSLSQSNTLGKGDYIILRYAPDLANVRVRLNSPDAPAISMIQDDSINAKGINLVYIECDPVAAEKIIFAQGNTDLDFQINPAPALKTVNVNGSFMPRTDQKQTIAAGANFILDTTTLKAIRFLATDYVDVSLNGSAINYQMLEDEIYTGNITSLKFTNNTASAIDLVIWEM
ncbi:MAG: hypothetical protein R3331_02095 [Sulfurospirillaceae bacterium]|nr:hypothetical protein [Sulfurospirillaceae bacterium]